VREALGRKLLDGGVERVHHSGRYRNVRRKGEASREGRCSWEDLPEYKLQVNQGPEYSSG
jgi:hypothetical protein